MAEDHELASFSTFAYVYEAPITLFSVMTLILGYPRAEIASMFAISNISDASLTNLILWLMRDQSSQKFASETIGNHPNFDASRHYHFKPIKKYPQIFI